MKGPFRIESLYAFVVVDDDGSEGVAGRLMPNGTWMPFIGADMERVEQLTPRCRNCSRRSLTAMAKPRKRVKHVTFENYKGERVTIPEDMTLSEAVLKFDIKEVRILPKGKPLPRKRNVFVAVT
jgi:hypothetical protein